jgi:hypothetical protein
MEWPVEALGLIWVAAQKSQEKMRYFISYTSDSYCAPNSLPRSARISPLYSLISPETGTWRQSCANEHDHDTNIDMAVEANGDMT